MEEVWMRVSDARDRAYTTALGGLRAYTSRIRDRGERGPRREFMIGQAERMSEFLGKRPKGGA